MKPLPADKLGAIFGQREGTMVNASVSRKMLQIVAAQWAQSCNRCDDSYHG